MNTQTTPPEAEPKKYDANRDPITGEPGSHPVGTGVGAAGGAAAGAAIGAVAGPVGMVVGGVTVAIVGGVTGHAVAEGVNPTAEDAYWRGTYASRPYAERDVPYDEYAPAYRTGYAGRGRYPGIGYDAAETNLQRDYEKAKGSSKLTWERAKHATRDAWHRVEDALPGDADGDGH